MGKGKFLFNGYRVSEKVIEINTGYGCTALKMFLMPLNYTLKYN